MPLIRPNVWAHGYMVTATVLSGFHCTLDLDLSSICGLMNIFKSSCFVNGLSFLRNKGYFWILSGQCKTVSVKRRLRTADCRLRTRGKMQTAD